MALIKAQMEIHETGLERSLAAVRSDKLFEDAKASLEEKRAGGSPTPRAELRRK